MANAVKGEGIPFATVETVKCPKCKQESGFKCRAMAGNGVTCRDKQIPHIERCIAYINSIK